MKSGRVLFLTDRELAVRRYAQGRLAEAFAFEPSPTGLDGFGRYLQAHPGEPLLLVANLVEEEFRTETLPHTRGRERDQLFARHGERLFSATPFRAARVIGREHEGRRDDRVLLSALSHAVVAPWIAPLLAAQAPLMAVSSVAHLAAPLPRRLGLTDEHVLLLIPSDRAGLRQCFFHRGVLRMTRLSPPNSGNLTYAAFVANEIALTERYLARVQLLGSTATLAIHVVGEGIPAEAARAMRVWALEQVARRCGVGWHDRETSDDLFGKLFLARPFNVYGRPPHLRAGRQHRLAQRVAQLGVAASVALILGAALNGFDLARDYRQTAIARGEALRYTRLLSADPLPQTNAAEAIKQAVETADGIASMNADPTPALAVVGRTLARFPEFTLRRIGWRRSAEAADQVTPPLSAVALGAQAAYEVIVEGEANLARGNYPRVLDRFNQWVATLRSDPWVTDVTPLVRPIEAEKRITQKVGTQERPVDALPFALRVVVRP